ncbi:hypothetical protein AUP68_07412 [Ilyonectria robusta]
MKKPNVDSCSIGYGWRCCRGSGTAQARACVVTLKAAGKETSEVAYFTGLPVRTINNIYIQAIKRSFDPVKKPLEITDTYVADISRSGRPRKQTIEI